MSASLFLLNGSPEVSVVALLAGVLLMYLEANRPGLVVPGCTGLLLVLLSGRSLASYDLSPDALALLAGGMGLMLLAIVSRHLWIMAAGAEFALIWGLRTLLLPARPLNGVVALLTATVFAGVTISLGRVALLARRSKRQVGTGSRVGSLSPCPSPADAHAG